MKGETSKTRFSEAQKLLDYGFTNYEYINLSKKGDLLKTINVDKGINKTIDLVFEEDSRFFSKKR